MNNAEARFLLNAYRPGGHDANDGAMSAALTQAKADPALGAWLARSQAHDGAVAAKLREIAPPAGLREAILAGSRASGQVRPPPSRPRWWRPVWLAAAAAAVALLGGVTWWRLPVGGATLDEFAVNVVARGILLQQRGADVGELKSWLAERGGPLPEVLPAKFTELRALGCRTLEFRGRDVSLVCFERGGKKFHVFVARRDDFLDTPAGAAPRFFERKQRVAAAWSDARNHYVLVSDADLPALRRLL